MVNYKILKLKMAETELSFDRRLVFIKKDQTKFEPADIESRKVDFVFLMHHMIWI